MTKKLDTNCTALLFPHTSIMKIGTRKNYKRNLICRVRNFQHFIDGCKSRKLKEIKRLTIIIKFFFSNLNDLRQLYKCSTFVDDCQLTFFHNSWDHIYRIALKL